MTAPFAQPPRVVLDGFAWPLPDFVATYGFEPLGDEAPPLPLPFRFDVVLADGTLMGPLPADEADRLRPVAARAYDWPPAAERKLDWGRCPGCGELATLHDDGRDALTRRTVWHCGCCCHDDDDDDDWDCCPHCGRRP